MLQTESSMRVLVSETVKRYPEEGIGDTGIPWVSGTGGRGGKAAPMHGCREPMPCMFRDSFPQMETWDFVWLGI